MGQIFHNAVNQSSIGPKQRIGSSWIAMASAAVLLALTATGAVAAEMTPHRSREEHDYRSGSYPRQC